MIGGAERGMNQTTTFQDVFEILTKYNFEIVDIYQQRLTVLFENKKMKYSELGNKHREFYKFTKKSDTSYLPVLSGYTKWRKTIFRLTCYALKLYIQLIHQH